MDKRLYDMTPRDLRAEIAAAQTRGDLARVLECQEQLALLQQIGGAFSASEPQT